ncbi:MAG: tripartite tricarboxylate transporter substrate binding protein, partial [Betaproteobacteria bacterium]
MRLVVPFGPGGIADLTARTVAQRLGDALGQPVVVDNRPGAGGVVAATSVAKADADGHTLLLMSNGSAISAGLFKSLPYDTGKDFAPVAVLGTFDLVIVVGAESKFRTLADLLAYAKANPDKLNLGTINIGSTQHLAAELFKSTAGVSVQVVPFNGTPAVVSALRGGQIDAAIEILGPMLPQIQSNAVRALAVTGEKRATALPGVPTVKESGIAGYVVTSWNALAAPGKTPKETIARLNQEIVAILSVPDVVRRFHDLNVEPHPGTPEQATQLLQNEIKR